MKTPTSGLADVQILSEAATSTFDESVEWYDYAGMDHFWFQWRFAALDHMLQKAGIAFDSPFRALDIGCGTGILRDQIEGETKWVVDGADLNLGALRRAKAGRGEFFYYDILEGRKQFREAYDLITLFDVIEHIENPTPFLTASLNCLKPGGFLIVNVPALQSLFSEYDVAAGHVRRYDKATLAQEWGTLAVDILDTRYWGFSMLPILALRKLRFHLSRSKESILKRGFVAPNVFIHEGLKAMMRIEVGLWKRPLLGTSVLMVVRKRN